MSARTPTQAKDNDPLVAVIFLLLTLIFVPVICIHILANTVIPPAQEASPRPGSRSE